VNHDRLIVWVVVEDHHLQQAAGRVCPDDEIPALAGDDSYGIANGVQHVFVADAVLACAVRDLHLDKVALSAESVKVALSTTVSISVGLVRRRRDSGSNRGATPAAAAKTLRWSIPYRDAVCGVGAT
jgi:hypothetical protein